MQQLSGQDAMFIHTEAAGIPQHISSLGIYDQSTAEGGLVRLKQIIELIEARAPLSPIFNRQLKRVPWGLDQPWWEAIDQPEVERHIHHMALPKPGDWRQLCILAARIHSRPLNLNKPLWEMYVIEGLDNVPGLPENCFAIMIKVHHAAMDGATGARFLPLLHDLSPKVESMAIPDVDREESLSKGGILKAAAVNNLRKPGKTVKLVGDLLPAWQRIRRGKKENDFHALDDKQRTRFQGKLSPHRAVDSVNFDFAEVRAVKQQCSGATINDVMLCIVSGALRHYLSAKGELPEKTLVSGCPIDVRSPEEQSSGGNMVGFMTLSLCSTIADPAERLAAIQQASLESKAYANALGPRVAVDVTDVLHGGVLQLALRAAASTGLSEAAVIFNTVVTNVPGPREQLYFCGAKLVNGMNFGPLLPNVGLFHIVYSSVQNKRGIIALSFTACRDMMPDPAFYTECLQRSYDELRDAFSKTPQPEATLNND